MRQVLEVINLAVNAQNFIGDQFSYLQEHGDYQMHLICSPGYDIEDFAKQQRIKLKTIQINRQITPWADIKAFFKICNYIKKNKIDIIIGHQAKGVLLAMASGWIMRVPIRIIFGHGILTETMGGGFKKWLIGIEGRFCSSVATNVICVSNFVKDYGNSRFKYKKVLLGYGSCTGIDTTNKFNPGNINQEKIQALRNEFGFASDDFVVGYSGRVVRDKGIVELVEAIELLKEKHPNQSIKLLIVGPAEIRDAIPESVLHFLQESEYVRFTGFIPYSVIQYYYPLMNVCVLASHREGLGLASLEAQAMERPAIVTDYTGCAETILDKETGFYTDGSPASIAEQVEKLLLDRNKAVQMGKMGRDFVIERFEAQYVHQNILQFLNSLK